LIKITTNNIPNAHPAKNPVHISELPISIGNFSYTFRVGGPGGGGGGEKHRLHPHMRCGTHFIFSGGMGISFHLEFHAMIGDEFPCALRRDKAQEIQHNNYAHRGAKELALLDAYGD